VADWMEMDGQMDGVMSSFKWMELEV